MHVFDHVHAEGLVFCTNISEHYGVIETMRRACHEDTRRAFAEVLDQAWSLREFGANNLSAAGGSLGSGGEYGNSSSAGTSSS